MGHEARRATIIRLLDGIDAGRRTVMDEVFHDDAIIDWPQSGERIDGATNRRGLYASFGSLPRATLRRLVGDGDVWVAEADLDYGSDVYQAVFVNEFRGDRIARQTVYWSKPFPAPASRAQWVSAIPAER